MDKENNGYKRSDRDHSMFHVVFFAGRFASDDVDFGFEHRAAQIKLAQFLIPKKFAIQCGSNIMVL